MAEETPQTIITPHSEGIAVKQYLGGIFWLEMLLKEDDLQRLLDMVDREKAKTEDAKRVIQKPHIKLLTPDSL